MQFYGQPYCRGCNGSQARRIHTSALHTRNRRAVGARFTDGSCRQYACIEPDLQVHVQLGRRHPDYESGTDDHSSPVVRSAYVEYGFIPFLVTHFAAEESDTLIQKIIMPFVKPIQRKILRPLKQAKRWPKLLAKWLKQKLKAILGQKEITKASYVPVGNIYIAKKLIAIILLVMLVLYFFIFIKPPKFVNKWLDRKPAISASADGQAAAYTGAAKVVAEDGNIVFEGDLVDGAYEGTGKLYADDGTLLYEGELADGLYEGEGKLFDNGVLVQEGTFAKGELVQGTIYSPDGTPIYKGALAEGAYAGQGTAFYSNGSVRYQGEFKGGEPSGQGVAYDQNGQLIYEGNFANGLYSGEGTRYSSDGHILYQGQFLAGNYNSEGKLLYPSGFIQYEGTFSNGMPSGTGSEYYENGAVKYEGEYKAGLYSGNGTLYAEDGSLVYTGSFLGGDYHGQGELYDALGLPEFQGLFVSGQLNGPGTWYEDGSTVVYQGYFRDGDLAPEVWLDLTPVKLQDMLGEPSSVEVVRSSQPEAEAVNAAPADAESEDTAATAEGSNPEVWMDYEALQLAFLAELDNSGSGEATVSEVLINNDPVLNQLYTQLAQQPEAVMTQTVSFTLFNWNGTLYTFTMLADGTPDTVNIRRAE